MASYALGGIRFEVEHRNPGPGGGPTLRVFDAEEGGNERLRFDCFQQSGHWHLGSRRRRRGDVVRSGLESIDWTVATLRREFASLGRARKPAGAGVAPEGARRRLRPRRARPAQRAGGLDAVRPESRRPSRGEKWTLYPDDVLPLWVADMDFPIADPIRRMLRFAVERSDLGYPIHPAPHEIGEIAAARMRDRFAGRSTRRASRWLCDVVQGLAVSLHQFAEPGEGALVQTPIYPPFLGNVKSSGRRLIEKPLVHGDCGYRVDLDGLRAALDPARAAAALQSHNPTGRVFRRDELEAWPSWRCDTTWWGLATRSTPISCIPCAAHPVREPGPRWPTHRQR